MIYHWKRRNLKTIQKNSNHKQNQIRIPQKKNIKNNN